MTNFFHFKSISSVSLVISTRNVIFIELNLFSFCLITLTPTKGHVISWRSRGSRCAPPPMTRLVYCSHKIIDPPPLRDVIFRLLLNYNSFLHKSSSLLCFITIKWLLLILIQVSIRELRDFGSRSGRDQQWGRWIRMASWWRQPGFRKSPKKGLINKTSLRDVQM